MKKSILILSLVVLSLIMVGITSVFNSSTEDCVDCIVYEKTTISQQIESYTTEPVELNKLYNGAEFIAYITDLDNVNKLLDDVYNERYAEIFPDTEVGLADTMYIVKEEGYFIPEDIDQKIIEYIDVNDNYSIATYRIDFSTETGVYASINVLNEEIFLEAQNQFLGLFVSQEALTAFGKNETLPELVSFGSRELRVNLLQDITITETYATPSSVYTTAAQILDYLCYGDNTTKEYYTVQLGDTVEGVGALNNLLSAEQIVAINSDVLKSTNQVIEPGLELNVTYFEPVIDVVVTSELIVSEIIYPGPTVYIEDSTLPSGSYVVQTEYREGTQNTKYEETWINGELIGASKISSDVVVHPQTQIIYRGTQAVPFIGSGDLRWPVDNPVLTCGWYCYPGHTALDMQNRYELYANIYAADTGKVVENSYTPTAGYYLKIDHNNGLVTQYNHFSEPAYPQVGEVVEKGQVIGLMGDTGVTTGVHLHFVTIVDGVRVDPCTILGC